VEAAGALSYRQCFKADTHNGACLCRNLAGAIGGLR
jgi:hypothetical protein